MTGNLRAKIFDVDKPNKNGRIYSKAVLEKALSESKFPIVGMIGMPTTSKISTIDEGEISHQIDCIFFVGDEAHAEITILDTPRGNILQDLLSEMNPVQFRSAGYGNIDDAGNVYNFSITSINAVLDGA